MTELALELVFKASGGCEIRSIDLDSDDDEDSVVWASDSDPEFMNHFGNEIMSGETDAEDVLEYLVENEILDEKEADDIEIFDESLDAKEVKE